MQQPQDVGLCAICSRKLIPGKSVNEHHLIPKTYKGTETILIHVVCHTKIHSVFTEQELYRHYYTVERLQNHPEMAKFIRWIANKDPEFRSRNEATREIRRKRR